MRFRLFSILLGFFLFGCGETPEPQPRDRTPLEKTPSRSESGLSKGSAIILTLKGKVTIVDSTGEKGNVAYVKPTPYAGGLPRHGAKLGGSPSLLTNGTTLTVVLTRPSN